MSGFARTLLAQLFRRAEALPIDVQPGERVLVHRGGGWYAPGAVVYWVHVQQARRDDRDQIIGHSSERRVLVALDDNTYCVAHPLSVRRAAVEIDEC